MSFLFALIAMGTAQAGGYVGDCLVGGNWNVAQYAVYGPYGPFISFTSIQDAIDAASNGDTICVLSGTYEEQLTIDKELTIQGWLGSCSTTLKPTAGLGGPVISVTAPNVTIEGFNVDGNLTHSGIEILSSGDTLISDVIVGNMVGTHGISINAVDGTTELSDVICQDAVTATQPGGHIYVGPGATLTSAGGLVVEQGEAPSGGGMFLDTGSSAVLTGSSFQFNTATSDLDGDCGGAIAMGNDSALVFTDGDLNSNDGAAFGGAICAAYAQQSTIEIRDSNVMDNVASHGGGLALAFANPSIVDGVTFDGNVATTDGGAIWADYSGLLKISNSTFTRNTATNVAGAVYGSLSDLAVDSSLFCENSAEALAAIAHFGTLYFSLEQSIVGSIFVDNTHYTPGLPAVVLANGDVVTTSKFTNNTVLNSAMLIGGNNMEVRNNLQMDHTDAVANSTAAGDQPAIFQYQMFWNNALGDTDFSIAPDPTNLTADPLLIGYVSGSCDPAGLHPQWNSPLVDAGDPGLYDLLGGPSDIGAFGGPNPYPRPVFDDIDGDGFDLALDCDDADPSVYPGASETCNGVDDDCNEQIDDGPDGDGDLVPDICDPCPLDLLDDQDGDGACDSDDPCPIDALDDSDNDGTCDSVDLCPGYYDTIDSDSDGVPDGCDACAMFDDAVDTDRDGQPDQCDPCPNETPDDDDGDGVCNSEDICPAGDDMLDADTDGVPNDCDPCPLDLLDDADQDGACDSDDLCPGFDDTLDADSDGAPDDCDPCPADPYDDSDADGVCDSDDLCPGSDDTLDSDDDGKPNDCDPCPNDSTDDSDDDGVCDSADQCPGFDDSADKDGDGVADGCDPCPSDIGDDTDGDGICDSDDLCPDADDQIDSDENGVPDACEDARSGNQDDVGGLFFCGCNAAGPYTGFSPLVVLLGVLIQRRRG